MPVTVGYCSIFEEVRY